MWVWCGEWVCVRACTHTHVNLYLNAILCFVSTGGKGLTATIETSTSSVGVQDELTFTISLSVCIYWRHCKVAHTHILTHIHKHMHAHKPAHTLTRTHTHDHLSNAHILSNIEYNSLWRPISPCGLFGQDFFL